MLNYRLLKLSLLFLLLAGCSTPTSEKIANSAKSDLKSVESILNNIQASAPEQCKKSLENDLNTVFVHIKNIDRQITESVDACKVEKDVLESKVINRDLVICLLCVAIAGLVFIKIKT